jgi:hypothetical protein
LDLVGTVVLPKDASAKSSAQGNPISIFSRDLMKQAKISAIGTYYKCISDLKSGGYIRYTPSYNPFLGSLIYIIPVSACTITNNKKGIMKFFLLPDKQDYRIMKVAPEDIDAFLKKYQKQVMLERNSIAELLIYFSAKLEEFIKN